MTTSDDGMTLETRLIDETVERSPPASQPTCCPASHCYQSLRVCLTSNIFNRAEFSKKCRSNLPNVPAALLVFYTIPCAMLFQFLTAIAYSFATKIDDCPCEPDDDDQLDNVKSLASVAQTVVFYSVYPLAGWLADVKWGRHKVIRWSLVLQWAGVCIQCISLSVQYTVCGIFDSVAKYGLSSVAFVLITFGTAGFFANVLAYGMEQMSGAPSMALRSYINWFNWAFALGLNIVSYVQWNVTPTTPSQQYFVLSNVLLVAILLTIVLCIDAHFHDKFINPKLLRNPYGTIRGVLRFAWKHKVPIRRSALTFWEEDFPGRLDLAKDKYGGPFTHESVEDVKTTLRIVVILLSLSLFMVAYFIVDLTQAEFAVQFKQGASLGGVSSLLVSVLTDSLIIPVVPILELVIIPLFPKLEFFLVSHLRVLGIACVCLVINAILLLIIDVVGHAVTENEVACFLSSDSDDQSLSVHFLVTVIPFFTFGLADLAFFIAVFVFICSQAPLNMNGMLIGLFYFLFGLYSAAGQMVVYPFTYSTHQFEPKEISCGFWLILIVLLLSVLGCIVYIAAAKWYRKRIRDDFVNYLSFVEEHFERQIQRRLANEGSDLSDTHNLSGYSYQEFVEINSREIEANNADEMPVRVITH